MKKYRLDEIKVEANLLNSHQPLGRFLIVLFRQFEDELLEELEKFGYQITSADLSVLRHIDPRGSHPVKIAELSGVSKQAISKQISKLEMRGLIQKKSDHNDSRAVQLTFTKEGKLLIQHSIRIISKIEKSYARKLGGKDNLGFLKASLKKLIEQKTD